MLEQSVGQPPVATPSYVAAGLLGSFQTQSDKRKPHLDLSPSITQILCYPSGIAKTNCKWEINVPLVTKGIICYATASVCTVTR